MNVEDGLVVCLPVMEIEGCIYDGPRVVRPRRGVEGLCTWMSGCDVRSERWLW